MVARFRAALLGLVVGVSALTAAQAEHAVFSACLGVLVVDLSTDSRQMLRISLSSGVFIGQIYDDTPAYDFNLRAGDVITRVGLRSVDTSAGLVALIRSHGVGEKIDLTVWRGGDFVVRSGFLGRTTAGRALGGHLCERVPPN